MFIIVMRRRLLTITRLLTHHLLHERKIVGWYTPIFMELIKSHTSGISYECTASGMILLLGEYLTLINFPFLLSFSLIHLALQELHPGTCDILKWKMHSLIWLRWAAVPCSSVQYCKREHDRPVFGRWLSQSSEYGEVVSSLYV